MSLQSRTARSPLFLTRVAAFVSLGIVLGLALSAIPNVELVTATCFTAGYLLGPWGGILTGCLTETLFAGFHPMGSSVGLLLVAQIIGMSLAGFFGAMVAKITRSSYGLFYGIVVVLTGVITTLIFDLLTNLAFPVIAGFSFSETKLYLIAGLSFGLIHLVSNFFVFLLIILPLLPRLKKALA